MVDKFDSLFSREYFDKRGSWCGGLDITKRTPGGKRGSLDSYLFPQMPDELSTSSGSQDCLLQEELPLTVISEKPEMMPDFVQMSKNQFGSRYWQETIPNLSHSEFRKLLFKCLGHIPAMMTDKYGNYLCQVLFRCASPPERLEILNSLKKHLFDIAKDSRGTHALQALIGMVSVNDEEEVFEKAFGRNIYRLSTHPFAAHVVQKMLCCLHRKSFIIREILDRIQELSCDKLGLCVVKLCISHVNTEPLRRELENSLLENAVALMKDPYGNYAIQHMIKVWGMHSKLYSSIKGHVVELSLQKFSSNVIEKCIESANKRNLDEILKELVTKEGLLELLSSLYGSYVMRTAYYKANGEQRIRIKIALNEVLSSLNYKKLLRKWQDFIQEL
jgi:hypothetical protein